MTPPPLSNEQADALAERLEQIAAERGISVAEVIREALAPFALVWPTPPDPAEPGPETGG